MDTARGLVVGLCAFGIWLERVPDRSIAVWRMTGPESSGCCHGDDQPRELISAMFRGPAGRIEILGQRGLEAICQQIIRLVLGRPKQNGRLVLGRAKQNGMHTKSMEFLTRCAREAYAPPPGQKHGGGLALNPAWSTATQTISRWTTTEEPKWLPQTQVRVSDNTRGH
jgi:hypothetical protein